MTSATVRRSSAVTGPIGPARASFVQITTSAESSASAGRPAAVSVAAICFHLGWELRLAPRRAEMRHRRARSGREAHRHDSGAALLRADRRRARHDPRRARSPPPAAGRCRARSGRSRPTSAISAPVIERSASAPANVFVSTITSSTGSRSYGRRRPPASGRSCSRHRACGSRGRPRRRRPYDRARCRRA